MKTAERWTEASLSRYMDPTLLMPARVRAPEMLPEWELTLIEKQENSLSDHSRMPQFGVV